LVNTLKTSKDFLEVISKGQKYKNSGLIFYFLKNNSEEFKLGISIKKKTGNAVYRNKLKRQIKNAIKLNLRQLNGFDIVIVNYEERLEPIKYKELILVFEKFFRKVKSF
tara:strand:+ start:184 stop:510 length:327 start_codon:yes stop_codon:yes gene_type:complete